LTRNYLAQQKYEGTLRITRNSPNQIYRDGAFTQETRFSYKFGGRNKIAGATKRRGLVAAVAERCDFSQADSKEKTVLGEQNATREEL
jgi:hypothetical protein